MSIQWQQVTVRLGDLQPWPRNPRMIKAKEAKRLAESFDEFGQVETIAIGPTGEIYNGHQRLAVLMEHYGATYEIDARQASRPLSEHEREKLTVYLHKGAAGSWDFDALADFDTADLLDWGFEEWELGIELEKDAGRDTEPQTDRAEELRQQWQTAPGQLWACGEHRLIVGDCTDPAVVAHVMDGKRADAIFDPPYGMMLETDWSDVVGSLGSFRAKTGTRGNVYSPVIGDSEPYDPSPIFELYSFAEIFLFGADYYCERLPNKNEGSWLVWDKRKESQADAIGAEFELIWSARKHKRRVLRHDWFGFLSSGNSSEAHNRQHPTQKPTSLIEDIVTQWCEQDVIADWYAGSGTTLIACENLGRKCQAMKISAGYVGVCLQRYQDHTGRTPVLIP